MDPYFNGVAMSFIGWFGEGSLVGEYYGRALSMRGTTPGSCRIRNSPSLIDLYVQF